MGNQLLASKIVITEEEPRVRTIAGVATSVLGALGICEKGPVGVATLCSSFEEYSRTFGGYIANGDMTAAMSGFFENGGSEAWVARTVHYTDATDKTTKTSLTALVNLLTSALVATGGTVLGSVIGPYVLTAGDTLIVDTDAITPTTTTFAATAGLRENSNAAPYALANNDVLTVSIDGGANQSIAFLTAEFVSIAAATLQEVVNVINAKLVGGKATLTSGATRVTITSDRKGTSSGVNVVAGGAQAVGKLNFTAGNVAGTGNVANISAVTVAEVKTAVELAVTGITVSNDGGAVRITRNTTGTGAQVQVDASSTSTAKFGFDTAVHSGTTGVATNTLRILGKYDGTYAHALRVIIAAASSGDADRFNLTVTKNGILVEAFANLSMDDTDANYVEKIVNASGTGSQYVTALDLDVGLGSATNDRPANVTSAFLSGGNDGLAGLADVDFTGADGSNGKTGMRAFDLVQDLTLLIVPGQATASIANAMITYCETTRSGQAFAILDPPAGQTAVSVITYFGTTAAVLGLSEYGAAYWPRVKVTNPNKTVFGNVDQIVVPPSGHIAGVYARTDGANPGGVYNAPAGIENGILQGVIGFETDECLEEAKRDLVYPKRINPLTTFPGAPRHIDGSRTLKGGSNFPSVPERRGVSFIEQSVKGGLQFARHKNNDEELRATVSRTVQSFLEIQMKNKAFRTQDPSTAFYVDFGDGLNPPSVQFAGQLIGRIGLATNKPNEYIILKFTQDTRALEAELAG